MLKDRVNDVNAIVCKQRKVVALKFLSEKYMGLGNCVKRQRPGCLH